MTSENLAAMIRRKELMRLGTEEALQEADDILEAVERAGGLTRLEIYTLWGYTPKPTEAQISARQARRGRVEALFREPTSNLVAMRRRKELLKVGTEEARREAEEIYRAVERAGGLRGEEIQVLLAD